MKTTSPTHLLTWEQFRQKKFKCRECGWIGKESEMKYADNGMDYSEYCPKCGDCMISNEQYHCDDAPRLLIGSFAELRECIHTEFQTPSALVYFRSVFSIAARNRWSVFHNAEKNALELEDNGMGKSTIIARATIALPNKPALYNRRSEKIELNETHFTETGFMLNTDTSRRPFHEYFVTLANGDHHVVNENKIDSRYFRRNNLTTVISFMDINEIVKVITQGVWHQKPSNEYVRQLSYGEHFGKEACYLVLKDNFPFKRGMIISPYESFGMKSHKRHPLHWKNETWFTIFNMACDLNLTTLAELEAFQPEIMSCSKQQFGCQRGCTMSCHAEGHNKMKAAIKLTLIKLYKEVFNG